jgi:excisionase family DNA binding protein
MKPHALSSERNDKCEMTATFYTVADLVEMLKLSRSQLYALIEGGTLRCHRFTRRRNGAIRVSQAQLDEYLKATEDPGEPTPTPAPPQRPAVTGRPEKQFAFLPPRS